jgi:predicted metal-dependent hydrolase
MAEAVQNALDAARDLHAEVRNRGLDWTLLRASAECVERLAWIKDNIEYKRGAA